MSIMHGSLHCKASAATPGRAAGQAGPIRARFNSRRLHKSCNAHFGTAASSDAIRRGSETPSSSPGSCSDPLPRSDVPASSRRAALLALGALSVPLASPSTATAAAEATLDAPSTSGREAVDTTITHLVALDVGIADRALKRAEDRTIGDKSIIPEAAPVGRIVIGLYGNAVPRTVDNFLALVSSGNLVGTTFSRVLAGEYIQAGKQGQRRLGAVEVPAEVQANPEVSEASAFRLPHYRPGTVSLALGENDEEPTLRSRPDYKPVEFLITTGPGPVPRLDGANIVFGRVVEGMAVVGQVASVPVFGPSPVGNSLAFNSLASAIGDDRAATVRRKYGKPLKAVVILGSEVLPPPPAEGAGGAPAAQ